MTKYCSECNRGLCTKYAGRDYAIGIVNRLRTWRPKDLGLIHNRGKWLSFRMSRKILGPTQPTMQCISGHYCHRVSLLPPGVPTATGCPYCHRVSLLPPGVFYCHRVSLLPPGVYQIAVDKYINIPSLLRGGYLGRTQPPVQCVPGVFPASYEVGIWVIPCLLCSVYLHLFPRSKAAGAWSCSLTFFQYRVLACTEPSWRGA
jgi:hypothetical protein